MNDYQKEHNKNNVLDSKLADAEFEINELKAKIRNLEFRLTNPDISEEDAKIYGINMIGRRQLMQLKWID